MPLFKKQILRVGDYASPDGKVPVTPKRLKHWATQFGKMTKAGLSVPSGWNHSTDPKQTIPTVGRSAKDNAGYLKGIELSDDGQAASIVLDIPLEDDAKRVAANLAEVSPIIYPEWKDGKGNIWKDVLTHIDLVLHPVEAGQDPFVAVPDQPALACSLRMGLDIKPKAKPVLYRMAESDGDDAPEVPDASETDNPDMPPSSKADDAARFESVIAYLAEMPAPIVLPSDTDQTNFLERLQVALMTAQAANDKAEAEAAEDEADNEDEDFEMKQADPQFAAMSLRMNRIETQTIERERKGLLKRLDEAAKSGRCTPAQHKTWAESLTAMRLSLTDAGDLAETKLHGFLESCEANPAGTHWDDTQRLQHMSLEEQEPPSFMKGSIETEEDAEKLIDKIFGKKKKQTA